MLMEVYYGHYAENRGRRFWEMSERQTVNTNIRLNLSNEDDRSAWTYLQNMDRKKYK